MLLTKDSIQQMLNYDTDIKPILQILDIQTNVKNQVDRYKMVLSDGQFFCQALLATKCNFLVSDGNLKKYSVICVTDFVCDNNSNRKIFIVNECSVVRQEGNPIGNPKNVFKLNNANPNSNNQKVYISYYKKKYIYFCILSNSF